MRVIYPNEYSLELLSYQGLSLERRHYLSSCYLQVTDHERKNVNQLENLNTEPHRVMPGTISSVPPKNYLWRYYQGIPRDNESMVQERPASDKFSGMYVFDVIKGFIAGTVGSLFIDISLISLLTSWILLLKNNLRKAID
ncbi:hypothetical protein SK128_022445 [Halocaridina rubra]|uniref:Uncharacterized protein n=1 Tax=Halocaridina rubra TaxID=373956 RepID=A0AAN8WSM3_HALRR